MKSQWHLDLKILHSAVSFCANHFACLGLLLWNGDVCNWPCRAFGRTGRREYASLSWHSPVNGGWHYYTPLFSRNFYSSYFCLPQSFLFTPVHYSYLCSFFFFKLTSLLMLPPGPSLLAPACFLNHNYSTMLSFPLSSYNILFGDNSQNMDFQK